MADDARDGTSAASGPTGSRDAIAALEAALLGESARLTQEQVESAAGTSSERSRRLWRALGFVDAVPDEPIFTQADVDALERATALAQDRLIDDRVVDTLARTLGQAMRRLAEAQVEVLSEIMSRDQEMVDLASQEPQEAVRRAVDVTSDWLPELERLMVYAYRRHVLAASQRVLAGASQVVSSDAPVVVGFCDIVNYTAMTRDLAAVDLAGLVDTFESTASDIVTSGGGRVVKMLGDEVMFVADDADAGAGIGLALSEAFGRGPSSGGREPDHAADMTPGKVGDVRVGLALGVVLPHGGDLFGPVVNLAARCTGIAKPATVVCERELAEALKDSSRVTVSRLRTLRVRGYEHLTPSVLRRKD